MTHYLRGTEKNAPGLLLDEFPCFQKFSILFISCYARRRTLFSNLTLTLKPHTKLKAPASFTTF